MPRLVFFGVLQTSPGYCLAVGIGWQFCLSGIHPEGWVNPRDRLRKHFCPDEINRISIMVLGLRVFGLVCMNGLELSLVYQAFLNTVHVRNQR